MTEEKFSPDAYYAEKGKVRFMMVTSKEAKADLDTRRKAFGLSQGDMLEVFLELADSLDPLALNLVVQAKRAAKKASRPSFNSLSKKIKGLPKEQLAALEKFLEEQAQADKAAIDPGEPGDFS